MARIDPDPDMLVHTNPSTRLVRVGFVFGQDAGAHGSAYHKPWWPSKDQLRRLQGAARPQDFVALARPMLPADMANLADAALVSWFTALGTVVPAQMVAWLAIWDDGFKDPPGTTGADPSAA